MTTTLESAEPPGGRRTQALARRPGLHPHGHGQRLLRRPPRRGDREWALIDAGMPGSADQIARAAEARFGPGSRPSAIVLTHGHFDHVGALEALARRWDAPVYAHPMEMPYLTGRSSYPPPDPSVGGGLVSALSWSYPRGPIDLAGRVKPLPEDGSVPGLPGWRWVFTPGHTPGHVALFRDADRTLIAGDAVVTTRQESVVRRDGPAPRAARAAHVLHPRLGGRRPVRRDPGRPRPRDRGHRPRRAAPGRRR